MEKKNIEINEYEHHFLVNYVQGIFSVLMEYSMTDTFTIEFYKEENIQTILSWLIHWFYRKKGNFRHLKKNIVNNNVQQGIYYTSSPLLIYLFDNAREFPHGIYKNVNKVPLTVYQWIFDYKITEINFSQLFVCASKYGNTELLTWIWEKGEINQMIDKYQKCSEMAYRHGHIGVIEWLETNKSLIDRCNGKPLHHIIFGYRYTFQEAFCNGQLNLIKWFYNKYKGPDLDHFLLTNHQILIQKTCNKNKTNTIEWLFEQSFPDNRETELIIRIRCFENICEYKVNNHSNIELIKKMWEKLYAYSNNNVQLCRPIIRVFLRSLKYLNLETLHELYQKSKENGLFDNEKKQNTNNTHNTHYLFNNNEIDVTDYFAYVNIDVAKFLWSLSEEYKWKINETRIMFDIICYGYQNIEFMNWWWSIYKNSKNVTFYDLERFNQMFNTRWKFLSSKQKREMYQWYESEFIPRLKLEKEFRGIILHLNPNS